MSKKKPTKTAIRKASRARQATYRKRIRQGELKRFQFSVPLEIGIKADYLTEALGCTKVELFTRLLLEEWERQGQPIPQEAEAKKTKRTR